jgi:hypothetical protein
MRQGPEHRKGWQQQIRVNGNLVRIQAEHQSRLRVPHSSADIAANIKRGRPVSSMFEETVHSWSVMALGRRIGTLTQAPSGMFVVGALHAFPRMDIVQAAEELFRKTFPRLARAEPAEDVTSSSGMPNP